MELFKGNGELSSRSINNLRIIQPKSRNQEYRQRCGVNFILHYETVIFLIEY